MASWIGALMLAVGIICWSASGLFGISFPEAEKIGHVYGLICGIALLLAISGIPWPALGRKP